ncbi:methyltransferase domain-containing protein [Bermanella marisrubri]|uniref:tRNA 5-carboxymethoxyuridine methyltransferase n=1 Tax=Bermanella marisrubri TaxID=207949 RepID=Q1N5H2_9GAMM|nr:methyltransferase domain-containing protein [Bermanella marisrubri]EAT13970.1 SAM-dependent methyltransferase [Oceanobacter sp. RED65] [Bermanella marisrubri]QIZ84719.1 methyltransferase domain-containing protein [Bermanella marisrubri]
MDRNFNGLSNRFKNQIYGTLKGQMRLALLEKDLSPYIEQTHALNILDCGAGQGQFSSMLAQHGHSLVLNDVSDEMLAMAQANLAELAPDNQTHQMITAPLQSLNEELHTRALPTQYDLVLNHAVLEWLHEPFAAIEQLALWVKSDGILSLMFYNLHAIVWRNLMNGSWQRAQNTHFHHDKNNLMPQNPLNPADVVEKIESLGFSIELHRGIRCVHDHMFVEMRKRKTLEEFVELESDIGLKAPYRDLGRYVHIVARKI